MIAPGVVDNSGGTLASGALSLVPTTWANGSWVAIDESFRFDYAAPTVLRWVATDAAGVVGTCNTTVTVVDDQPPILGDGGDCSGYNQNITAYADSVWYRHTAPSPSPIYILDAPCRYAGHTSEFCHRAV